MRNELHNTIAQIIEEHLDMNAGEVHSTRIPYSVFVFDDGCTSVHVMM